MKTLECVLGPTALTKIETELVCFLHVQFYPHPSPMAVTVLVRDPRETSFRQIYLTSGGSLNSRARGMYNNLPDDQHGTTAAPHAPSHDAHKDTEHTLHGTHFFGGNCNQNISCGPFSIHLLSLYFSQTPEK